MNWAPYWPYLLPLLALPWVWPWVRDGSRYDVPLISPAWVIEEGE